MLEGYANGGMEGNPREAITVLRDRLTTLINKYEVADGQFDVPLSQERQPLANANHGEVAALVPDADPGLLPHPGDVRSSAEREGGGRGGPRGTVREFGTARSDFGANHSQGKSDQGGTKVGTKASGKGGAKAGTQGGSKV